MLNKDVRTPKLLKTKVSVMDFGPNVDLSLLEYFLRLPRDQRAELGKNVFTISFDCC